MRVYRLKPFSRNGAPSAKENWPPAEPASEDATPKRQVLTVSQLTHQIKNVFEKNFPFVWVEGEVSEPKIYPSGHLWFDLKDSGAVLKSVMWRAAAGQLKFALEQGLQVLCCGRVEFYPPRGDIKFIVEQIEPKGLGTLQLAFEQLCAKLEKEGLFELTRKRPLPAFPKEIGMVTSPSGAAIKDMLRILRGHVRILVHPTRVQGEGAAEQIARGIAMLNTRDDLDCIIIGRGGGSLEDLWAFNEEVVARAVAASRLPVISAVGHEKDTSISDLVADLRSPTPTKAAEMILAQRRETLQRFLDALENPAFNDPESWLAEIRERLEDAQEALAGSASERVSALIQRICLLRAQVFQNSPEAAVERQGERLFQLQAQLSAGMLGCFERFSQQTFALAGRLDAHSPLAVLSRGYSITFDGQGKILRSAGDTARGETIRTRLHHGEVISEVTQIEKIEKEAR
ncbi:MAG: exodeoxyribonuclease VII large subunit [Candidatus Omnitrophica bacterium]|nr:exodeoxyribonuclease VII large subunit [Candidatus Omnitrophota bacterium]